MGLSRPIFRLIGDLIVPSGAFKARSVNLREGFTDRNSDDNRIWDTRCICTLVRLPSH